MRRQHGGGGAAEQSQQQHPEAVREEPNREQHHPWPHQIELLLDRERPQVIERQRLGEAREVRPVHDDRGPVREVEGPRNHLPAHAVELGGVE